MRLNPREQEKLMLHYAGELAKARRARGIKLNYIEATALISSELIEMAREGKEVSELMQVGRQLVKADECMEGVADLVHCSSRSNIHRWNKTRYCTRTNSISRIV